MTRYLTISLVLALTVFAASAWAENPHDHMGMTMAQPDPMATMMHNMNQPKTGNADADFIRGMIPHHQGAVDMAQQVLRESHDPEVQTFAKNIIEAQNTEIAWMRAWLAKKGIPETGEFKVK